MSWRLLSASVPAPLDDEVASVLGGGSLGVEIVPAGAGVSEVRVYLGPGDDVEAWRRRAARVLLAHGVTPEAARITLSDLADGGWVERWQAALEPIPLGSRFVVLPHDGLAAPEEREPIRLIPGMAFGTGEHETTRLCAAALESLVRPGSVWLDLGCGTGILAIVAAFCGASRVLALDLDPEAAHVASQVVHANGAANAVRVATGSLADTGGETFDGIVANIQASFFLAHARVLAGTLARGGVLVISGFLAEDVPEIEAALSAAGLSVEAQARDASWASLVATRGAR